MKRNAILRLLKNSQSNVIPRSPRRTRDLTLKFEQKNEIPRRFAPRNDIFILFYRSLIFLLVAFAVFGTSTLSANGSVYSRFGVGDRSLYGGSRLYAMANTGLSLHGDGFINLLNPAGLAGLTETRISAGFEYLNFSSEDNLGKGTYARGEFQGIAFAFPLSKDDGASLLFEFSPYSSVHYSTERVDTQVGATSNQKLYGSGGLTNYGVGGSYSPWQGMIFGFKFNYLFGGIHQLNNIDFTDPTFTDSELRRFSYHSGVNFTFGGIYHGFAELFDSPSLEHLSLGAVLTTATTMDVREESFHVVDQIEDTLRIGSGSFTLPLSFGVGVSYLFSERYTISGDVQVQDWKPENFSTQQSVNIRRSTRLGIGFEAQPARDANSFSSGIAYRAGIAYHASYIKIGNEPIDELLMSGGLGLPIGFGSRINLGLHVGFRGTTNNNLQKDTIVRLSVSLSAGDTWFLRYEEE